MEKFESKIGSLVFAIFVAFCLLDVAAFVLWVILGIWWPTLVLLTFTVLFIIPPYFFTWYKLTDDSLKITFGYFMINRTIPYDSILSVRPVVGHSLAPALSSRRIEIIYYKKNKSRRVCVSPGMYSTFLNMLTDSALESAVAKNRLNPSQEERFERPAKAVATSKMITEKSSSVKNKKPAPKKSTPTKAVKKPAPKVAANQPLENSKVKESGKKQPTAASAKPAVKKVGETAKSAVGGKNVSTASASSKTKKSTAKPAGSATAKPAVKKVGAAKSEVVKKSAPVKDSATKKVAAAKTSTTKKPTTKKISTSKKSSVQKTPASKKQAPAKEPKTTTKKAV